MFILSWLSGALPFPNLGLNHTFQSAYLFWAPIYKKENWCQTPHLDHRVFIFPCWSQPTCLPLCSDAELILRDWKYWFASVSYVVVERGGSAPSSLLVPCSHIGTRHTASSSETHNYSRPFRLVQQPVQLWLRSLIVYFIPFPLLRGAPQHNGQASIYNNVCDDKHCGS